MYIRGRKRTHLRYIYTYNLLASKWKFILGLSRKFIVRKVSNRVFVFLPITLMVATIVITMIMVMSVYLEKRMPNNYHNYEIKIFKNLFLPVDIFSLRNINSHSFRPGHQFEIVCMTNIITHFKMLKYFSILLSSIPACEISSSYETKSFLLLINFVTILNITHNHNLHPYLNPNVP